ncbi:MAG: carbohydrate ABC transporter permease [Actinobacteria bacterium]|nr:carbohydrate ABC transporter permease [Actinomycetota bacterium]
MAFLGLFPYIFMVLTSFKNNQQFVDSYWGLPVPIHFENYAAAWGQTKNYFVTTFIVVAATIIATLFLGLLSGFILSRFVFVGRQFLFTCVGLLLMVPWIAALIPLFVLSKDLKMLNTIWVLIVPMIAGNAVLSVILFKNYIDAVPQELFDCAVVFGATGPQIFRYVVVPLSFPIVGTISLLTMINVWNEYFWPLLTVTDDTLRTVSVGITFFQGQNETDYGGLMAGYTLASIPLLLLFTFLSKYFLAGIQGGLSVSDK